MKTLYVLGSNMSASFGLSPSSSPEFEFKYKSNRYRLEVQRALWPPGSNFMLTFWRHGQLRLSWNKKVDLPCSYKRSTCDVHSYNTLLFVLDTQPQNVLTELGQAPECMIIKTSLRHYLIIEMDW